MTELRKSTSPLTSILVVEDDELIATYLQAHLRRRGYRLTGIVKNGLDALALANMDRPDIVLMDILLSGEIDGIEAADRIRACYSVPILFLTAHVDSKIFERAKIADPSAYLLKPFNERELYFAIELALHRHQLLTRKEQEQELRYEKLFRSNPHPMWVCERHSLVFIDVNDAAMKQYGYRRNEFLNMNYSHVSSNNDLINTPTQQLVNEFQVGVIARHRISDGTMIDVEISRHELDYAGQPAILMLMHNVTRRLLAETETQKISQLYRILSETNQALVRSTSSTEIFNAVCKIAVEHGQFRIAWIALIDVATGDFDAVTQAFAKDYPGGMPLPVQEYFATDQMMAAKNLQCGQYLINDDFDSEQFTSEIKAWVSRANIASCAIYPLCEKDGVFGVFGVYAAEKNYFDSAIVHLLKQMTENISYGIVNLAQDGKRREAEALQRQLSDRISALMNTMTDGFVALDRYWRFVFVNRKAGEMLSRVPEALIGNPIWSEFPNEIGQPLHHACLQSMANQVSAQIETHDANSKRWFENRIYPSSDGISVYFQEITERKASEIALKLANRNYHELVARIPIGIFTFRMLSNREIHFDYVSPRFCDLNGFSAELVKHDASKAFDVLHTDDRETFFRISRKAVENVHSFVWEGRILRENDPDKKVRWMRVEAYPTINDSRDIIWNGVQMDITERCLAENQLAAALQRLQALSARLLRIQEEERRNLARELHDEIGQSLSALKIALHTIGKHIECNAIQPQIRVAIDIAASTLDLVRQMSLDLRPPQLDDLGLPAAIRWNLERQCKLAELNPHFTAKNIPQLLPESISIACYRISQEAITNTIKHAKASNIWIDLRLIKNRLDLFVRDDGIGFDYNLMQEKVRSGLSMGMVSMQERATIVNGKINIDTQHGAGTILHAAFILDANTLALGVLNDHDR